MKGTAYAGVGGTAVYAAAPAASNALTVVMTPWGQRMLDRGLDALQGYYGGTVSQPKNMTEAIFSFFSLWNELYSLDDLK